MACSYEPRNGLGPSVVNTVDLFAYLFSFFACDLFNDDVMTSNCAYTSLTAPIIVSNELKRMWKGTVAA
jgi:hypothetical protein